MSQEERLDRHLAWDTCYNARDLGGYPTGNGRRTRLQALIRTDSLHHLTPEGQVALRDYGVRTLIDLRSAYELEKDANPFAALQGVEGVPRYLNLPLMDPDDQETNAAMSAAESMLGEYCVILERNKARIGAVINAVAASLEEGAVLIHCQGGKDRTGIIVALLLSLVGVPRETIIEDYALSETRLEPAHLAWLEEQAQAQGRPVERPGWMYSRPETMQGALDYVDRQYGGVESYLEAAGVTRASMEKIRKHLMASADDDGIEGTGTPPGRDAA